MTRTRPVSFAVALALLAALPCGAAAGDKPATAAPAVTEAKTRLGVGLRSTLTPTAVGQPSVLTLTTTTSPHAGTATLTVRPDDALTLVASDLVAGRATPLGASNRFSLTLVPASAGLHFVNVFVRNGGRAQALAIPVQVGAAGAAATASKRADRVQVTPSGERVISVPANR